MSITTQEQESKCKEMLSQLNKDQLIALLTDRMLLSEVDAVWFLVLNNRMEEEIPGRGKEASIIELYERARQRNLLNKLYEAIAERRPDLNPQ